MKSWKEIVADIKETKWKRIVFLVSSIVLALALVTVLTIVGINSCNNNKKVGVSFDTNGAEAVQEMQVNRGDEVVLPVITRDGYRFDGWYLSNNFEGEPVTTIVASSNVTYYAKWTQVYAVNLDVNGGTLDTTTIYLAQGENIYSVVKDLIPTKSGLTFGAWFNGNNELSASSTMKAETLNLVAQYKVAYTVEIYKQNLNDDGYTKETVTGSEYVGKKFTSVQKVTGFNEVTEDVNALTKTLSADASENVFVHKFDRMTCTITFNYNVPGMDDNDTDYVTAKYGETIEIPVPSMYQVKDYCLLGWSVSFNAKEVEYPVDMSALLYNTSEERGEAVTYEVTGSTTLYGVWQQGYTNMFGGDDSIYYMGGESEVIYLCRANVFFQGIYDAGENEFYFYNVKNKLVLTGRLYDNGKFAYADDSRAKDNSVRYTTDSEIVETEKIRFDKYNKITYTIYAEDTGLEIDSSVGTYEVASNGDYVATFTSGSLAGQTISFIKSFVTENGVEKSVFQVRNEDECQIGKIILLGIRRDSVDEQGVYVIGYYEKMYFELDGFGTAKFTSNGTTTSYSYSTDENGDILLKDVKGSVIETICLIDVPDSKNNEKGYMVYEKAMDDTFALENNETLTLDGLYQAEYKTSQKTIKSYYRHWTNPMGGVIVSIIDPDTKTEYRFLLNSTTKEVEEETVDTYTARKVLGSYAEYYYQDDSGVYYAPMLVLDEVEVGRASLYGYTTKGKYVKVAEGTYSEITSGTYKGLYQFIRDKKFNADEVSNEPIDLATIVSFMFALDSDTTNYNINYWYTSNDGTNETEYFDDYQNTDITSEATLKLVGGFAFYKPDANTRALIGTYKQSGTLLTLTVDEETYYFTMDLVNKKFTVLEYAPYKAYLRNADGTSSDSIYFDFDGTGEAVYAVDGLLISGKITNVKNGNVNEQTAFGESIYKFTPNDNAHADKTFEYIVATIRSKSYYMLKSETFTETFYYAADDSQTQGSLEIDGYGYWAKFDDYKNEHEGVYYVDGNTIVLEASGRKFYFDFLAGSEEFIVRGQEYGVYALLENQYSNGLFVELDGYGSLTVFELKLKTGTEDEYERDIVSSNGVYTIEDGVYTFTYGTGVAAKAYVCILNSQSFTAVNGESYNTFAVRKDLEKEIYVDNTTWSVLILDEFGRATKSDKEGKRLEGNYTFITDELLYFFNGNEDDACLYTYDNVAGEAAPISLKAKSYYTQDLKSLYFSEAGFAIFNGNEEEVRFYTYVDDGDGDQKNDVVVIYTRTESGAYTSFEFGTLGDTIVYNGETYYKNADKLITFTRLDESTNYPLLGEDIAYELTDLRFLPSGGEEFEVTGQAKMVVKETGKANTTDEVSCTVTRQIVDGVAEMYVTVASYYRYYITATYTNETQSYEVTSLNRDQSVSAYFYWNEYLQAYMYEGGMDAAQAVENKFGTIEVFMDYNLDGSINQSNAKVNFGEKTPFYDMNGDRLSSDNAEFEILDNGMSVAEFVAGDEYTYQVHFGIYTHRYVNAYGYYVLAVVRVQEIEVGEYTLSVGRVVGSEETEEDQPIGEVYTVELKKGDEIVEAEEFFYAGEKLHYVVRERDDDGYVTKATYYTIDLVENDSMSVEEVVPTYETATITTAEATILCEEDPTDPNANYVGKDRYVEMLDEEITFINLVKNKRYVKTCTYDADSGIYTVKTQDKRTYYVKVVGEHVVITDNLNELV